PGGESMGEVQQRITQHLKHTCAAHGERRVVLVSHCDVIRAAILHCLDMSLDLFARIEIAPASISTLVRGEWGCKLVSLNEQVAA
ncbi:MAG TPA: histidine phosphatase family protein, partial [Xanthobacteraceae bacterium]|nr:histidine phosphatase family protein [Xanthobacteraceae bacterium]